MMLKSDMVCPFCNAEVYLREVTTQEQREIGLVYLSAKCTSCREQFDGAGIGRDDAMTRLENKRGKRVGTSPERWRIKLREPRSKKRY